MAGSSKAVYGLLQSHWHKRRKVRVERNRPGCQYIHGYVVGLSRSLCVVHVNSDFRPDGYLVSRLKDVTNVRHGPYEKVFDRMLKRDGLLDALDSPPRIDLRSMASAIRSVHRLHGRLIVQCEDEHEDIEDFYLGRVAGWRKNHVVLHHCDALGKWERKAVLLQDVTLLQIESHYLQKWWSHHPPKSA